MLTHRSTRHLAALHEWYFPPPAHACAKNAQTPNRATTPGKRGTIVGHHPRETPPGAHRLLPVKRARGHVSIASSRASGPPAERRWRRTNRQQEQQQQHESRRLGSDRRSRAPPSSDDRAAKHRGRSWGRRRRRGGSCGIRSQQQSWRRGSGRCPTGDFCFQVSRPNDVAFGPLCRRSCSRLQSIGIFGPKRSDLKHRT